MSLATFSTADVILLITMNSLSFWKSFCIYFVSVILSKRGIKDGKDSFLGKFNYYKDSDG